MPSKLIFVSGFAHGGVREDVILGAIVPQFNHPTLLGWQTIGDKAERLAAELAEITGPKVVVAHSMGALVLINALQQMDVQWVREVEHIYLVAPVPLIKRWALLTSWRFWRGVGLGGVLASIVGLICPWRGAKVPFATQRRLFGHTADICSVDSSIAFVQLLLGAYGADPVGFLRQHAEIRQKVTLVVCTRDRCVPPSIQVAEAALGVRSVKVETGHCGWGSIVSQLLKAK